MSTPPQSPSQLLQTALEACQRSDWMPARRICAAILRAEPAHADAQRLLGMIDLQQGNDHYNRGLSLHQLGRREEALESYARASELRPDLAEAHNNRGVVLRELGRDSEALEAYSRAIELNPASPEAFNNRAVVLRELRSYAAALRDYDQAIALRPQFAQAHANRGSVLAELGRQGEALAAQERAISIDPRFADAWVKRGVALRDLGRHGLAAESFRRALDLDPAFDWLEGLWLQAKLKVCDWQGLGEETQRLVERIERGERAALPFATLALQCTAAVQKKAAEIWVNARLRGVSPLPAIAGRQRPPRLRVGYFSGDFREHAVSVLMAEVLELHDRASMEVTAFSFGPDTGDSMRQRIAAGVERFVDVRERSDEEIARLARDLEIDIAVDLTGYTEGSRTGVFARRAAPIQASFLGYPGTMGADFIDYLIADATIVPDSDRAHYTEHVMHLPHCYLPSDAHRPISDRIFTREEEGLPPEGFVFCSFNNSFKITPTVFDAWMRLLHGVDGSVLWLRRESEEGADNLRREAQQRGIDPARIVFAGRVPSMADHLARHRLADLFVDTLPYNAHTTASDALWAGLPVLTCMGETFAGRVGASLLRAVGLPELVTQSLEEYEALALALATDPERLDLLREKLAANRLTQPLFDSRRFVRDLERAYAEMFERGPSPQPSPKGEGALSASPKGEGAL